MVAIGACAPIHPRVGQSGPPGPRVRAGSLFCQAPVCQAPICQVPICQAPCACKRAVV